jgi:hypothetical protein
MLKKMLQNFVPLGTVDGIDDKTIPELIALISWKSGNLLEYFEECIDEDAQAAQARYQERHNLSQNPGLVFHGTSKSASDGIVELGFRKTKGARAKYGEGTYVTPWINEAWRYTAELTDMTVLICYMHVGKTAVGSKGQTEFVDSSDPTLPAVHTLTSPDKRILVGSGEEGQLLIVARSSWRFVPELMNPATLQAIGGGNKQVNAEYRGYLASLPRAIKLDIQPWPDVSAYNSNGTVHALLPDRPQLVGAGGAAAAAAADPVAGMAAQAAQAAANRAAYVAGLQAQAAAAAAAAAAPAAPAAPAVAPVAAAAAARPGWVTEALASHAAYTAFRQAQAAAAGAAAAAAPAAAAPAAGAAAAPLNSKKRAGEHVAGSAVKAPKLESSHYYARVELPGLRVGDRVKIKSVFAPYKEGGRLINAFGCVRAIGKNCNRTIVLVEMENQLQTDFVKAINSAKNGAFKSAFPYVRWSSTEQQEDHLLAVRPGDVVRA